MNRIKRGAVNSGMSRLWGWNYSLIPTGLLSAGMILTASFAWASTPEAEPGSKDLNKLSLEELMKVEIATVTTASKREEKTIEAPATVIVITANDIQLRGYSTLKDVLRDLPGMDTRGYYFSEDGTEVAVRGIVGNNKIVVLVNGMRVNPPGGENFPFRNDFSVRNAEQIEVIYGSGSTLYGRDAVSVVINIITRKPSKNAGLEAGVAGGLHNEREAWGIFEGSLDKAGNVRLSGSLQYHDSDLTRLDKEYPGWWRDHLDVARPKGAGLTPERHDLGINGFMRLEAGDFSLQTWYRESKRSSSESMSPAFGYIPEAIWEDSSFVTEAKYVAQISDQVRLDSAVTYNHYRVDPSSRYIWEDSTRPNSWFYNDYKYANGSSYAVEETVRVDLTKDLSLLAGVVAATYDVVPKCTVPGGAHGSLDEIMGEGGSFTYYMSDGSGPYTIPRVWHEIYETYGGYLEGDWQILKTVKLIAGARLDKDTRCDDLSFTPRAGLIWNAADTLTVKYKFATAYISPAPYFADNVYQNTTQLSTVNSDLKPETSRTHEVDFNYNIRNFQLGLALYYGDQDKLIQISDRNLPLNEVETVYLDPGHTQPISLIRSANGGTSHNEGMDLYGRATIGTVSPWFSYSYTRFEMDCNGVTTGLQGISEHNGRVGLTWAATSKLFVTPSFAIRSTPANTDAGALGDELHTPWEAGLYVLYNLSRSVDLFADIRNITDHHYALAGLYGTAVPQETLSGVIGMKARF
ncbi:MAG: TonB-dependent receptor [bacterium]